jgi:aldose 1-epimerase
VLDGPDSLKLFSAKEKDELKKGETSSYALFAYTSPEGDQGYPGELYTEAIVGLVPPSGSKVASSNDDTDLGSIVLIYRAKVTGPDGKKVVTPVNLTQVCDVFAIL